MEALEQSDQKRSTSQCQGLEASFGATNVCLHWKAENTEELLFRGNGEDWSSSDTGNFIFFPFIIPSRLDPACWLVSLIPGWVFLSQFIGLHIDDPQTNPKLCFTNFLGIS